MSEPIENSTHITVPIFPLPNVVLFPGALLPLHVFEARYRAMVADALAGDRRLGMALLKPGWEADYEGSPPIHPLIGFGVIEDAGKLEGGRYLVRLRGEGKGRVAEEVQREPYRKVLLRTCPEGPTTPGLDRWVARIESMVRELHGAEGEENESSSVPGGGASRGIDLIHAVAAELPVRPEVKLSLLALDDLTERARRVTRLLDLALSHRRAIDRHRRDGEFDASLN
jgi:Lon protease-like protein